MTAWIDKWANDWRIPAAAREDLKKRLGLDGSYFTRHPKIEGEFASESRAQQEVRLEASNKDILLFRNNVGVLTDDTGRPVRYGLANESKEMNKTIKSSDLIGIRKVFIEPYMIGRTIGQFVARECKHGAWKFGEDPSREGPQLLFIETINRYGGDAAFAAGAGTL